MAVPEQWSDLYKENQNYATCLNSEKPLNAAGAPDTKHKLISSRIDFPDPRTQFPAPSSQIPYPRTE